MMMNLFSMFDPNNFFMNLSWFSFFLFMLFPLIKISKMEILKVNFSNYLNFEYKLLTNSNFSTIMLISLFFSIVFMNLMSMIPFSFCNSTQISIIFPFAFSLWFSNFIFFLKNKTFMFFSHLVPNGTPFILMPFLVLIELISNLIRPITLSVRLVANIIAGHLLMHLLSNLMLNFSIAFNFLPFLFLLILTSMELGVALIQGYIFSSLLALYSNEIH